MARNIKHVRNFLEIHWGFFNDTQVTVRQSGPCYEDCGSQTVTWRAWEHTDCQAHSQTPFCRMSGVGPQNVHFQQLPRWGWCCWLRGHIFRNPGVGKYWPQLQLWGEKPLPVWREGRGMWGSDDVIRGIWTCVLHSVNHHLLGQCGGGEERSRGVFWKRFS